MFYRPMFLNTIYELNPRFSERVQKIGKNGETNGSNASGRRLRF